MSDSLILLTDITEKLILLGLLGLSVWSVSIIIDRRRRLKAELAFPFSEVKDLILKQQIEQARALCTASLTVAGQSLKLLTPGLSEAQADRLVASQFKQARLELERGLGVLATLGSNAPFLGLFGTVLGIIRAFAYLGAQTGSSAVMSGVSQALYATAAGLFVALPAVAAFNYFSKQIRDIQTQTESLKDLFIARGLKG